MAHISGKYEELFIDSKKLSQVFYLYVRNTGCMRQYHIIYLLLFYFIFCLSISHSVIASDITHSPLDVKFAYALDTGTFPETVIIKMLLTIDDNYYTYTHNEKEGLPTKVVLQNSSGTIFQSRIFYPEGEIHEDTSSGINLKKVYSGEFPIFLQVQKDTLTSESEVQLSLLLCSSKHCIPVNRTIPITLPNPLPSIDEVPWEDTYLLYTNPVVHAAESERSIDSTEQTTDITESLLPWDLHPRYFQAGLEPTRIELALLFGFLAGLILNIMPCVLPVLTLKFSFILSHLGYKGEHCLRYVREQNLLFAAGILSWFVMLALGVEVLELAWGGFFQSVPVVYGLMLIVFILALSLFGFFTLPIIDFKIETTSFPRVQAYFTGVMTTLLATPCSGPLLGGVLGWAVLQPFYIIFIVFLATGLGMSLPYIIFAFKPQCIRFLPRPGAWCGTLEQLVGFFLLGTTIYLLSILPETMLIQAVVTLLITAFAVWCWGVFGGLSVSYRQRVVVGLVASCMIAMSVLWSFYHTEKAHWLSYSDTKFRKELGLTPMLVEFTADWCPTCKLLEKTVLTTSFLEQLVNEYGIKLIKVDLTNKYSEAEALLRALGSVSIPVTAIFPSGEKSNQPLVLRDVYTSEQLEKALYLAIKNSQ